MDSRSAQRRRAARRRAIRRRRAVALLVVAAVAALLVRAGTGGGAPARPPAPHNAVAKHTTSTHAATTTTTTTTTTHTVSPGSLPQTDTRPTSLSPALMAALWAGVVHNSTRLALPAFFPEGAYVQLKSIGAPQADWTDRLVRDFGLDIGAAHALLGRDAARARLISVNAVESYAHWIVPGVCVNSIGYWELPNARVVYSENGVVRSFGIASMISWRGVWYVVHFGAILRPAIAGFTNAPAAGPGVSDYSGTC